MPEAYAISSQFERVVIFRFKFQADLLAGLETMIKQNHIQNAVILAGAGSVIGYQVHQVSNREFPSKNMFEQDPTAPADLIAMNGYVMNGPHPRAHHAGQPGESLRRPSGAGYQGLHLCDCDGGRAARLAGPYQAGR